MSHNCSWSFPDLYYDDFKHTFPNAEIEEDVFYENVEKAIKQFDLVDFETFFISQMGDSR